MSAGPFTQRQVDQIRAIVREELAEERRRGGNLQAASIERIADQAQRAAIETVRGRVCTEAQAQGPESDA